MKRTYATFSSNSTAKHSDINFYSKALITVETVFSVELLNLWRT